MIETGLTLPKKAFAVNDNPISDGFGGDNPDAAPSTHSRSAARSDDSEMREMRAQRIARHAERFGGTNLIGARIVIRRADEQAQNAVVDIAAARYWRACCKYSRRLDWLLHLPQLQLTAGARAGASRFQTRACRCATAGRRSRLSRSARATAPKRGLTAAKSPYAPNNPVRNGSRSTITRA